MNQVLDLDRFPLDDLASSERRMLVERCQDDLVRRGMFNLEGLVRPQALSRCLAEIIPVRESNAFTHKRTHNVYFKDHVAGLAPDHPALRAVETINHTVCADQIPDSLVCKIYAWPPLAQFLADTMDKAALYTMADPLARVNVMAYGHGEALNWHFDRSEFTTTLLLQAPEAGGEFQYRSDLRTDTEPNYDGVVRLLCGDDMQVQTLPVTAGTLNVFRGTNTAHRVTPIQGARERIIAVLSYYEQPGVLFSGEDRMGFFGRIG